jgi:hypothetical protein
MKLAWVTHHLERDTDSPNPAHLPGRFVGGAEMTDAALKALAPDGVDVVTIAPEYFEEALACDDIVITGTDLLSGKAMEVLAEREPVVFIHHEQPRSDARRYLLESARVVIMHTPAHFERERAWLDLGRVEFVLSPMDPSECWTVEPKLEQAVWANRMHDLKGPRAAAMWAARKDVPLIRLTNTPRSEVLRVMAESRYYVHLPLGFESESRATIEAVLSGCEVIANDNVGLVSVPGWNDRARLADMVASAGEKWWSCVTAW